MRTDAEGLAGLVPAPRGPGGKHAKPSSPPEPDFDYERPLALFDRWVAAPIAVDARCRSFFMRGASAEYMSRSPNSAAST